MRRAGVAVLTRSQLLEGAWDMAFESRSNIVDVYVRYLREKIDRPFGRESIETVRGVGYRLREDGVSRLPIRLRLTLPFALGMAVVLAAMGVVVYLRVGDALLASVDQNLRAQAAEALAHAAARTASCSTTTSATGRRSRRSLDATGRVVRSTPPG